MSCLSTLHEINKDLFWILLLVLMLTEERRGSIVVGALNFWDELHNTLRRGLFPFRKRSLPFLTVDAIIGNQAFSHGRCNICSELSHNKVTNTFLNSLRKNKV